MFSFGDCGGFSVAGLTSVQSIVTCISSSSPLVRLTEVSKCGLSYLSTASEATLALWSDLTGFMGT